MKLTNGRLIRHAHGAVLNYNATFINDFGVALFNQLFAGASPAAAGTFISPVSVMLALALLLNGAAPGSLTFWYALASSHHTPDS